jgi:acetyl esterase/lipase
MKILSLPAMLFLLMQNAYSTTQETIYLWPGNVPGESNPKAEAVLSSDRSGDTTRITEVTHPELVVYEANPATKNGAAIIICPGGGYRILAIDKEGYEIASWLSDLGYTAFVLKYRVPQKHEGALQDVLRATRYVRAMHSTWDIETDKIGLLGFSAGGSLAARASTRYDEKVYEPVDDADAESARPDFSILIYPAYLDEGPDNTLSPDLKVNENTPPMFLFVAADDPYANSSLVMSSALRLKKVPFELHILPTGGHGYGMRPGNTAAETWPNLCEQWLNRVNAAQNPDLE